MLGLSVYVIGCVGVSMCGRQCLETQITILELSVRNKEERLRGNNKETEVRKKSVSFHSNIAYAMCLKYLSSKLLELNVMPLYLQDIFTEST